MWFNVERLAWLSEKDEDGHTRQGLGLKGKNIFLSDIFSSMTYDEDIPNQVKKDFPKLTKEEYISATEIIWLLLISTQWFSSLSSLENDGVLDMEPVKNWLQSYRKRLIDFRKDPGEYLGITDTAAIQEYRDKLKNIG